MDRLVSLHTLIRRSRLFTCEPTFVASVPTVSHFMNPALKSQSLTPRDWFRAPTGDCTVALLYQSSCQPIRPLPDSGCTAAKARVGSLLSLLYQQSYSPIALAAFEACKRGCKWGDSEDGSLRYSPGSYYVARTTKGPPRRTGIRYCVAKTLPWQWLYRTLSPQHPELDHETPL